MRPSSALRLLPLNPRVMHGCIIPRSINIFLVILPFSFAVVGL
jgi:hypothetical protein